MSTTAFENFLTAETDLLPSVRTCIVVFNMYISNLPRQQGLSAALERYKSITFGLSIIHHDFDGLEQDRSILTLFFRRVSSLMTLKMLSVPS